MSIEKNRSPWLETDKAQLKKLLQKDTPVKEIALIMKRTPHAIGNMICKYGWSKLAKQKKHKMICKLHAQGFTVLEISKKLPQYSYASIYYVLEVKKLLQTEKERNQSEQLSSKCTKASHSNSASV